MKEVLLQVATLLNTVEGSENVGSFLATLDNSAELVISAATPPFAAHEQASEVILPQTIAAIHRALQEARIQIGPLGTILPLRVGPLTVGVIYIDKAVVGDQTLELLRLLGNQAAAAIHNAQLCELATVDVLTGVYVRGFFEQALIRELAASFRARQGLALLIVDVDDMKRINEVTGHLAGDQALAAFARLLRRLTRAGDIVGRFAGDAFALVLRDSKLEGPGSFRRSPHRALAQSNGGGRAIRDAAAG